MKLEFVALPVRGSYIAPIFDFSAWFILVKRGRPLNETNTKIHLQNLSPMEMARVLLRAGVKTVICGCISDSLQKKLERSGIRVIWGITGPIAKVLDAFQMGELDDSPYRVLMKKARCFDTKGFFSPVR